MKVFVFREGKRYGPYSVEKLREFLQQGNFTVEDLVCLDGENWQKISEVPGLTLEEKPVALESSVEEQPQVEPTPHLEVKPDEVLPEAEEEVQVVQEEASDSTEGSKNKKKILVWSGIGSFVTALAVGLFFFFFDNGGSSNEGSDGDYFTKPIEESNRFQKGATIVAALLGEVSVTDPSGVDENSSGKRSAREGEVLLPGSLIETGSESEVILLFSNGHLATLGPDTKMRVDAFVQEEFDGSEEKVGELKREVSPSRMKLDLDFGEMIVDVKKLNKESSLVITTDVGIAGIRGTRFVVTSEKGSVAVSVLEGLVEFLDERKVVHAVKQEKRLEAEKGEEPEIVALSKRDKERMEATVSEAIRKTKNLNLADLAKAFDPSNPLIVSPVPDVTPDSSDGEPVVEGATLMVGEPGVVVLREKHKYMNWIKLDVGAPKPIAINLTEQQQDDYGDFLEGLAPDDQLKVTVVRNGAGRLVIETLDEAPTAQSMGEPFEENISGENAVSLDGDIVTFNIPTKGELTYELPSDRPKLREQIEKLVVALNENPSMGVPLKLRLEEGRIVGIDSITIPQVDIDPVPPVRPEPTGELRVVVLDAPNAARILPDQRIVEINVDGVRRLPYTFRADEEKRIRDLVAYLEKGGKGLKLDVRVDGNKITALDFTIPASVVPVGSDLSGPLARMPESAYVLWLPSKSLPGKPVRWQLDLPNSGSIRYDQPAFSSLFDAIMRAVAGVEQARVWQTDFHGPQSFYNLADAANAFEAFAVEAVPDPADPDSQVRFSLKTVGTGRSIYSLEFNVKRGVSVEIDFSADMAKNAADRGFVLRIPKGPDNCVDLYFVSNKHFAPELGYPPVARGEQLKLSGSTLRFLPSWPYGQNFHVLTKGNQGSHSLGVAPASGAGGTPRPDVFFSPSVPSTTAFVMGYVQGFPQAIVMPKQGPQHVSEIMMNVEYFASLGGSFQSEIAKYDAEMKRLSATLPNPQVYDNLRMFGRNAAKLTDYSAGSSYGEYLFGVTTQFAQQTLGWDDPTTKAFNERPDKLIGLIDLKSFPANQQALGRFWGRVASKLKEEAVRHMDGSLYNAERADHDVDIAFRLVNFFMHVERTFGMKDTNLAVQLQHIRDSFDSPEPDKGLLGKLQKEILRMGEQPKGKEVGQKFMKFNKAYLEHASQSTPSDKLVWQEYSKALKLMSDAAAVARFGQERAKLSQYDQWLKRINAKFIELKAARDAAFRAGGSQIQQARERLVAEKWALALFKINPPAATRPATWDRVSDLVTFR